MATTEPQQQIDIYTYDTIWLMMLPAAILAVALFVFFRIVLYLSASPDQRESLRTHGSCPAVLLLNTHSFITDYKTMKEKECMNCHLRVPIEKLSDTH